MRFVVLLLVCWLVCWCFPFFSYLCGCSCVCVGWCCLFCCVVLCLFKIKQVDCVVAGVLVCVWFAFLLLFGLVVCVVCVFRYFGRVVFALVGVLFLCV